MMDAAVFLMDENASETLFLITDNFPPVAVSIALKAPTTAPFSAFRGASASEDRARNAPEKIFFSPSRAFDQSPVKTPLIN